MVSFGVFDAYVVATGRIELTVAEEKSLLYEPSKKDQSSTARIHCERHYHHQHPYIPNLNTNNQEVAMNPSILHYRLRGIYIWLCQLPSVQLPWLMSSEPPCARYRPLLRHVSVWAQQALSPASEGQDVEGEGAPLEN